MRDRLVSLDVTSFRLSLNWSLASEGPQEDQGTEHVRDLNMSDI